MREIRGQPPDARRHQRKDHIRTLIERPDEVDFTASRRILADLEAIVAGTSAPQATVPRCEVAAAAGWLIGIAFAPDVLRNGTDPLGLLDELRGLGPCTVVPQLDAIPDLISLDPQELRFVWHVTLAAPCPARTSRMCSSSSSTTWCSTCSRCPAQPGRDRRGA